MFLSWYQSLPIDFRVVISLIPYTLRITLKILLEILPYLIGGIILSEVLKFTSWTKIAYKFVSKSPVLAVFSASIIGIISPLCTYGTIPVLIQLYKSGIKIAPLVAFLAGSSLMNPQLFIMTAGGIGMEMAIARTLAVFVFSIITGFLCYLVPDKFIARKNVELYEDGAACIINREKKSLVVKELCINTLKSLKYIGGYLLIGVIIAAIMQVYTSRVTNNIIYKAFAVGSEATIWIKMRSILAGAVLGVPLSACGGAVIPLVHGMMLNGMGKGTALAFFIVGPAMRPAPLMGMAAIFRPAFIALYCLFLIICSLIMGLVYI